MIDELSTAVDLARDPRDQSEMNIDVIVEVIVNTRRLIGNTTASFALITSVPVAALVVSVDDHEMVGVFRSCTKY